MNNYLFQIYHALPPASDVFPLSPPLPLDLDFAFDLPFPLVWGLAVFGPHRLVFALESCEAVSRSLAVRFEIITGL